MINDYLISHSLDESFVKSLGWTWGDNDTKITIPIYDDEGKLMYSRYRHLTGDNKFTTDKGGKPTLYCAHKIKKHTEVVLCEGEPDAARLWQEGIPAVTGTSGVKTLSKELASKLKGKVVKICLDNDEAGSTSIEKYISMLSNAGIESYIIKLPDEYKDICDFFTLGSNKRDEFLKLKTMNLNEWYAENEPEEFGFETISEILHQDIPPEEWLVNRILPSDGFAFIVGAEATGKSFYTLTLANAVATGTPWLDKTAVDKENKPLFEVSNKKNVLIIDKENTKRRVQSRARWLGITADNIFYLKYPHFFELADPNEEDGISKIAKSASRKVKEQNIKFIIIDSFTDVMIGNENAAGDVQGFFDAMRRLFPDTSILVLHHASKPSQGVVRSSSQRARGSTNIMAQVYSAFYVEALPKSLKEFTIEQTKAGDAEKFPKFYVELDVKPILGSNGKTKVEGIIYKGIVPTEEMKSDAAVTSIENAFRTKDMLSRQELLDVLQSEGISKRTALRAIKDLKEDGRIDSIQDPNNKSKRNYIWKVIEEYYEEE